MPPEDEVRAAPRWAVALAFAAHVLLTFAVFRPADVVRDEPFFADDYPQRFRYALSRSELLERGQLIGYDPAFLAGYPEYRQLTAGGHVWELALAAGGRTLGYGRAFNLAVVLMTLSSLPLLALAARAAGLGAAASSWVPLVALPVLWTGIPLSFPLTGNPLWVAASALAIGAAALYRRFLVSGRVRDWALATLATALIGTVHEVAALLIPAFAVPFLMVRARALDARRVLGTIAIPLMAVLANGYWMLPFWKGRGIVLGYGGGTVEVLDGWFSVFGLFYPHGLPVLLALYGFAWAGWRCSRSGERPPGMRLLLGTLAGVPLPFAILGYGWRVTAWLEPYRFLVPGTLALTLVAALGLAEARARLMRAFAGAWPWASPALAVALCLLSPFSPPLPIRAGLTGEARGLVTLLRERADPERRLLLEDSSWAHPDRSWTANLGDAGHRYFGTHLPSLLPELTGLELLDGEYPGAPYIQHQVVRFETGLLQNRPVEGWGEAELGALLERYAVGHVLVWSEPARRAFDALATLVEPDGRLGELALYRVRAPSSRFLRGSGRIASSMDRIELHDLVADGDRVVLRYHFDPALRAEPPVVLERVPVEGDPVGFVALRSPPRSVTLGFHPERQPRERGTPRWSASPR